MVDPKTIVKVRDVKKQFSYSNHKNDSLKRAITQILKPKDKSEDTFFALDGISFDVKQGDFFGILGRNGSGKSTLLKIISEIYQPTSGSVSHDGKLVSFIELGVGFKSELTGRENVYLNGGLLGFSKKEIDAMYDEIVEFAELEKFMNQRLKNYSSGMKVRLAFSLAIRSHADILILDEVLAVGDAAFKRKSAEYFESLKEDKSKTVILVTHSMGDVRNYCNRAIVIDDGKIVFEGSGELAASEYLNLFKKSSELTPSNRSSLKADAVISDIGVDVQSDGVKFNVKVRPVNKLLSGEEFVFGMKIKDDKGRVLAGFNNLNAKGGRQLFFDDGKDLSLLFTMDNILGKGRFTIDAALRNVAATQTFDYIQTAKVLDSDKEGAYYPLVLPVQLTVGGKEG